MNTWIALFRGINVGGNNRLPMADLKRDLESLNLQNVRTYIQSGNVVFDSTAKLAAPLARQITRQIEQKHGFRSHLIILKREDLLTAIEANPFPDAKQDPKTLHFFFLAKTPLTPDTEAMERAKQTSEKYELTDGVFYLLAPDGIARSKLAAKVEKHLGVVATARNYRTVDKLASMVKDV